MEILVILGFCLTATVAQLPRPCDAPREFEGRIVDYNEKTVIIRAQLSYDELGQRIRYVDDFVGEHVIEYLRLYATSREYVIDRTTRQCNTTILTGSFEGYSIARNASFRGEAYIGGSAESEGVLCQFWEHTDTFKGSYQNIPILSLEDSLHDRPDFTFIHTIQVFAYPSCLPVHEYFIDPKTGLSGLSFFDLTLGIKDPDVFLPPPECTP